MPALRASPPGKSHCSNANITHTHTAAIYYILCALTLKWLELCNSLRNLIQPALSDCPSRHDFDGIAFESLSQAIAELSTVYNPPQLSLFHSNPREPFIATVALGIVYGRWYTDLILIRFRQNHSAGNNNRREAITKYFKN